MLTLVLLPGMDGTGALFAPFVAALRSEFIVNAVHYPTTEPLGYAQLEAVARKAFSEEGPFVILGESFSGPIAISLAASCSSGLKGLILCCTFVSNPRPAFSWMRPLLGAFPVSIVPTRMLDQILLGSFSTPALRAILAGAVGQVAPSAIRARLRAVLAVNASAQLSTIKVPVLYVRASRDRVVPSAASKRIAQLCPQTKIVQVEGPHLLLQAAPQETAQIIRTFLREVQSNRQVDG